MSKTSNSGPFERSWINFVGGSGILGRGDFAAPDASVVLTGQTPGPLGRNDCADPDHPAYSIGNKILPQLNWASLRLPHLSLHLPFLTPGPASSSPGRGGTHGALGIPSSQLTACSTDEQTDFKHRVYDAACRRASHRRSYFGGLPEGALTTVEGKYKMRTDAATAAKKLLAALHADLTDKKGRQDAHALKVTSIAITSGYRDPRKDFHLWDSLYAKYYHRTCAQRDMLTGGPHGATAVHFLAGYIGKLKAAPGYSNHTQGIAFDITTNEGGNVYSADSTQNRKWESTWLRQWMLRHAGEHKFHKLATEAWHWDYVP